MEDDSCNKIVGLVAIFDNNSEVESLRSSSIRNHHNYFSSAGSLRNHSKKYQRFFEEEIRLNTI